MKTPRRRRRKGKELQHCRAETNECDLFLQKNPLQFQLQFLLLFRGIPVNSSSSSTNSLPLFLHHISHVRARAQSLRSRRACWLVEKAPVVVSPTKNVGNSFHHALCITNPSEMLLLLLHHCTHHLFCCSCTQHVSIYTTN